MKKFLHTSLMLVGFLLIWEYIIWVFSIPSFLFPPPSDIYNSLILHKYIIAKHFIVTLTEALTGYLIGITFGYSLAILVVHVPFLAPIVRIITIASQSTPKIAIAPIIVVWLGFGLTPKIFFAAFVCFFPIFILSVRGLSNIDPNIIDYVFFLKPSKWDMFRYIRLPNSIPILFNGLKLAVPLCLIGAIVGEFVMTDSGLGYLIQIASGNFDMSYAFSILFVLSLMGICFYHAVEFFERKILDVLKIEQQNFEF